jgi:hypothetical protein
MKDKKADKEKKPDSGPDTIELLPDAWERFEKALDRVAKSTPMHRTAKSSLNARKGFPKVASPAKGSDS